MKKASSLAMWAGLALMAAGVLIGAFLVTGQEMRIEASSPVVAVRTVSADATSDNGQRKLARAEDGTLYLAYSAPNDGVEQVHVSKSLDQGQSWKPEIVLGQPGIWSDLAALASAPGRVDATWVDYSTVGHVWYSSLQDGEWEAFRKISPGPDYAGFPVIAIKDGVPSVAWYAAAPSEETQHGSEYEIRHTMLTPDGWTEPELLSTGSRDALNPSMALGEDGTLQVAWFQDTIDVYGIHASSLEDDTWTTPELLSVPEQTATGASIELDSMGRSHAVWEQTADGTLGVGYAMQVGGRWQTMELLTSEGASDPVVAVDGEDRIYVLWSQEGRIIARVLDGRWSEPIDLGQGTNPTSLSGENVFAAWTRPVSGSFELVTSPLRLSSSSPGQELAGWVLAAAALAFGSMLVWRSRGQAFAPASLRTDRTSGK